MIAPVRGAIEATDSRGLLVTISSHVGIGIVLLSAGNLNFLLLRR